jgi:arylsulfatase
MKASILFVLAVLAATAVMDGFATIPSSGCEGMIITQGGMEGGYGLYVKDGRPTFVYNYLDIERTTITGKTALPSGKVQLKLDFAHGGKPGEIGRSATRSRSRGRSTR